MRTMTKEEIRLTQERDQARCMARELIQELREEWRHRSSPWEAIEEWEKRCPWLKEE